MTTTLIETPAPDPIADAIAALTAAARRERTIGAGTPNEHIEPVDFGEIACHVITAVAANVGGVEVLLSAAPDRGKPTTCDRSSRAPPGTTTPTWTI